MTFQFSFHLMSLIWGMPVDAAVRTLPVIEEDSLIYSNLHLPQASKRLPVKELVLDGIVDTLSHCIVLGIATLGHTRCDVMARKLAYIVGTGILAATVRMTDERLAKSFMSVRKQKR